MNLTCSRDALRTALAAVAPAVPGRTTKPVLACVLIRTTPEGATLTGYDTEVGVVAALPATVTTGGACCVPHDILTQIVGASDAAEVSLTATADGATLRLGSGRFELPVHPADEYPDPPAPGENPPAPAVLPAAALAELVRRTEYAAGKDSVARFALNGVLWEIRGGVLTLVATDTKRLAVASHPVPGAPDGEALLPAKAIRAVARALDGGGDAAVRLTRVDARIECGGVAVFSRLVEGKFPPWRDILGQSRKRAATTVTASAGEFLARVRAAAICTDDAGRRVEMAFRGAEPDVTLSARTPDAGASEVTFAPLSHAGPDATIAADPQYLADALKAFGGDATVAVEVGDADKPFVLRCGDDSFSMIMPLSN